jgi:adenylate cyclase
MSGGKLSSNWDWRLYHEGALVLENLSGDPSQDYFVDGITDALITDLAKLSGLDVIARNSVSAYKGRLVVLADVARNLGDTTA